MTITKRQKNFCYCCATSLMALCLHSPVIANPSAVNEGEGAYVLEDIVVTARRRDESLQDVPIAITVLTMQDIDNIGIESVSDFVKLVPNAIFDNALNLGTNYLMIRGQTQSQYSPPPVAIVVDGVLTISPLQFNVDEFDLQQVEVLKGPQGALYGRNAIAGVINLTTRKPGDELEGRLLAGYGRGEEYRLRGSISGPLVADRLFASVGAAFTDRRGQIRNITTGEYSDKHEDFTGRARLVARPSEAIEIDLKYTYADTKGRDPAHITSSTGDPSQLDDPFDSNRVGSNPRELHDLSIKADWDTGMGIASLILAYVHVEESVLSDLDFSPTDILRVQQDQKERGFSQEFRFASDNGGDLRWLVGAYHVKSKRDLGADIFVDPFFFGLVPDPMGADFLFQSSFDVNRYENYSGFSQVEYDLTSAFELALALRYDHDTNSQNAVEKITFKKWQPKATLTYKAAGEIVIYSSVGRGFRAGDFNASGATFGESVILAETATTYELGLKTRFLSRRVTANAAVFYTDLENGQFKVFDGNGATNVGINIDKTRILGFELETAAILTDSLSVHAAFGYTDAEVRTFTPPTGYPGSTDNYIGNTPARVPDYTLNLGFSYDRPVTDSLGIFLRTDYRRIGHMYWDLENDYRRKPVDYLDLRAGVQGADERWSVTAWVQNALNDKTTPNFEPFTNTGHPLGIDAYYPAAGATYGIEILYKF